MSKPQLNYRSILLHHLKEIRDGPLENLWGGGGAKYKKNIRAREN